MITTIAGPTGCTNTVISIADIIRLEKHSLRLLEQQTHNLYVFVRKAEDPEELFHLFSYARKDDMELAHESLTQLLAHPAQVGHTVEICAAEAAS